MNFAQLVMCGTRIVIPQSLRSEVLRLAHEEHQGIMKMKTQLTTNVWWPKIDSDAEKACRSCLGCPVVGEFCPPEPINAARRTTVGPCMARCSHRSLFPSEEKLLKVHLLQWYAIICTKGQTMMRKYVHLGQSALNCAKCSLHKEICITVNIQIICKTSINVSRNSNSLNNFHLRTL